MNRFVTNLLLAASWAAFQGQFTLFNLAVGFVIGFGVLWALQPLMGGPSPYFRRAWTWSRLLVMFHYELILGAITVAWDVLTPTQHSRPGMVEVPLDVTSDTAIFLVTNLISLTPGTLSLDVSEDRKTLYVHAMFAHDPEATVKSLKQGMERWVKEAVET
ncbi:Na+/H+ antiporter subunit E [Oceaniglobus roseus]|uniref:Na+/H+ antiporter subunit E n=1 Tax=Oceaniglobus roseus TaxID=1737570 RepID=UPI000C7F5EEF|nr:Na+/H+ antiporter subunit E [Kandeliimicrobium roseum]